MLTTKVSFRWSEDLFWSCLYERATVKALWASMFFRFFNCNTVNSEVMSLPVLTSDVNGTQRNMRQSPTSGDGFWIQLSLPESKSFQISYQIYLNCFFHLCLHVTFINWVLTHFADKVEFILFGCAEAKVKTTQKIRWTLSFSEYQLNKNTYV